MPLLRAGAALVAVLLAAACGSAPAAAGPSVVASTDVYGAVASAVGGATVQVTSLIHAADADPHEYEPTPADTLAVSRATVFIANGGGYDDFASKLYDAAGNKPISVVVTSFVGAGAGAPDFDEHVWYDLPTMKKLADYLATSLGAPDQPNPNRSWTTLRSSTRRSTAWWRRSRRSRPSTRARRWASPSRCAGYLLDAAGLVVVTPPEFSEAVEDGTRGGLTSRRAGSPSAVQSPDPTVGLLIVSARQRIRHAIAARARGFRLTSAQFWALVALHERPGVTPGELGQWMMLEAPAASRLVSDVAKRKLVDVRPDREDRRRTRLFLTERGTALAAQLTAIAAEYRAACTRGMTASEIEALRSGLRRVSENVADFDRRAATPPPARAVRRA